VGHENVARDCGEWERKQNTQVPNRTLIGVQHCNIRPTMEKSLKLSPLLISIEFAAISLIHPLISCEHAMTLLLITIIPFDLPLLLPRLFLSIVHLVHHDHSSLSHIYN